LALAFPEAVAVGFVIFTHAAVAADALFIFRVGAVLGGQRAAAGMAQLVPPGPQSVGQADALVENETVALPQAAFFGDVFEIFEDAALQVEHLIDALRQQVIGRFLAADAAGAEHGDAFALKAMGVVLPPCREIAEAAGGW